MGKNLFNTTGEFTPDKLIADNAIPVTAKGIRIASGEGKLKRGTLLGISEDGTYKRTDTTDGAPEKQIGADCILADDVDATEAEVVASAYVSGTFNPDAIILPNGKNVTDHETELRQLGIYLKAVQEY